MGLLVVGMHRSGTSAATKIISLLGAELPGNLMPPHVEFNASGFWESLDIVAINDELLTAAGSSWDDVLPIDPVTLPRGALTRFRSGAKKILQRDFSSSNWLALKDPRIGRLLRPWLGVVRACGAHPLVVIPIRHPWEVAASLHRREGFSPEKSIYLWLRHMVDVIRDSRDDARAIVIYDELMQDWCTAVERLGRDLGVVWPINPQTVAPLIEQFLDKKLRHHALADAHCTSGGLIAGLATELYASLCNRISGLNALAESIHLQLVPMETVFAPLQRDAIRRFSLSVAERDGLAKAMSRAHQEIEDKVVHIGVLNQELEELRAQQVQAASQLSKYEQTLASERQSHSELSAAFEDKVGQNLALSRELDILTNNYTEIQLGLSRAEANYSKLDTEFVAKCELASSLKLDVKQLHEQLAVALVKSEEMAKELAIVQDVIVKVNSIFTKKDPLVICRH